VSVANGSCISPTADGELLVSGYGLGQVNTSVLETGQNWADLRVDGCPAVGYPPTAGETTCSRSVTNCRTDPSLRGSVVASRRCKGSVCEAAGCSTGTACVEGR